MMVCAIIGLLVVASIISALVDSALGLDDSNMRYNCLTERWEFMPTRYDIALEMIIRS